MEGIRKKLNVLNEENNDKLPVSGLAVLEYEIVDAKDGGLNLFFDKLYL